MNFIMAATMVTFLLVGLVLGGTLAANKHSNNTNVSTYDNGTDILTYENDTSLYTEGNMTMSEDTTSKVTKFVPTSIDDFVVINLIEYGQLKKKGLKMKGLFGSDGMWFVGANGTNYLLVRKSKQQQKEDWEQALENSTGATVCVDGVCLDRTGAQGHLDSVNALINKQLVPGTETPFAIMVSFFIVAAVTGISGNVLIITSILRSKSNRNSTNVLICSLAISDILVLAVCLPMQVVQSFFFVYNLFNKHVCRFWIFMKYSSVVLSVLTMAAMALDRYIAVCYPLKAKFYCTSKNAHRAVVLIWIISVAASTPVVFFLNPDDARCILQFRSQATTVGFYGGFALIVFIVPLLIMVPLYVRITRVLWRSTNEAKKLKGMEDNANKDNEQVKVRKQIVKMLLLVMVMFMLCWGPAVLYDFIRVAKHYIEKTEMAITNTPESRGLHSVGLCNSFVNPILYTVMSKQYQLFLKSLCPCSKKQESKTGVTISDGKYQSNGTSQETVSR